MKKITEHEIIDHGVDHAQYFQGCGTSFTKYTDAVTGCGDNAKEAYNDALENLAGMGYDVDALPSRPRGIRKRDTVRWVIGEKPGEFSELYYYVSIRVR